MYETLSGHYVIPKKGYIAQDKEKNNKSQAWELKKKLKKMKKVLDFCFEMYYIIV